MTVGWRPLVAVERPAVVPLSFAQNRLWFLDQLQGPSSVYNMAAALRLGGPPGRARRWARRWSMWWAATRVCARCLWPRTGRRSRWWCRWSGPTSGGRSSMPAGGRTAGWRRPSTRWRVAPFDLAAEIPLRATLFRGADDEHVLVAVVHHIAADGWSIAPLVADLGVAYAAPVRGAGPGVGAVAGAVCGLHVVAARAAREISMIPTVRIAAQLAYWQQALAGYARAAAAAH